MIELDHAGDPPEAPGPVILLMHQLSASTRAELLELAECLRFERDRRDAQDCAAALRVAAE
ncbi:MAG TPA: hypothetical protein VMU87_21045 [Stellaceae bacterium]|nr:hypothetical protein [Stellaceae bacterium]